MPGYGMAASQKIRSLLHPFSGVSNETIESCKKESLRIERSLLVLKQQIENASRGPRRRSIQDGYFLGQDGAREEEEVEDVEAGALGKEIEQYVMLLKPMVKDLAEIFGVREKELLDKLGASRTLQGLLL
jgi:hypothetical protein